MNIETADTGAYTDFVPPTWFSELATGLSIRAQFVLSGNVRDLYPLPRGAEVDFVTLDRAIWHVLRSEGVAALLIHDPVSGLRLHPECNPALEPVLEEVGLPLGEVASTPAEMQALATTVMDERRLPMALVFDYASVQIRDHGQAVEQLFIAMDKAVRNALPPRPDIGTRCPDRNPILWVVERSGDLPDWFGVRNPGIREMSVGLPDLGDRTAYVSAHGDLHDTVLMPIEQRSLRLEQFAVRCEGMTLNDMRGVLNLARAERIGLADIDAALRSYRLGTTRNPWTSPVMRSRVKNARSVLESRVKGQPRALEKTYDILVRSIMGLSGAQTTSRGNRPRGCLFFVGPTGVGKTELAKAVAEVMFGDESAMNRFDMSEFMNEASIGRLVGPPPGAPGHENGGELVNAVRARPFGVFLFDEIEKGHPRILDAFLQILDDGRLSDSRGETGYFSEALIIFTSNIGMVGGDRSANSGQNVLPSDSRDVMEEKLTKAVSDHFRFELKRPELFNRLGQNIVPFEFINTQSSGIIFSAVVKRVIKAVKEEHDCDLIMTDEAMAGLEAVCTFELNDGGRGIGNRIESNLINPLSRELFGREGCERLVVTGLDTSDREARLICEDD